MFPCLQWDISLADSEQTKGTLPRFRWCFPEEWIIVFHKPRCDTIFMCTSLIVSVSLTSACDCHSSSATSACWSEGAQWASPPQPLEAFQLTSLCAVGVELCIQAGPHSWPKPNLYQQRMFKKPGVHVLSKSEPPYAWFFFTSNGGIPCFLTASERVLQPRGLYKIFFSQVKRAASMHTCMRIHAHWLQQKMKALWLLDCLICNVIPFLAVTGWQTALAL